MKEETITTLCGRDVRYWIELQKKIEQDENYKPRIEDLLIEIRQLRGKINFYESRVKEMFSQIRFEI